MNFPMIILILASFAWVFSQFGSRLQAQRSLLWWCVFAFIIIAAIEPEIFRSAVNFLGIQLISNFLFGSLILFCILQLIEESASQSKNSRQIRELVTHQAAQSIPSLSSSQALVILPTWNEEASLPTIQPSIEALRKSHPDISFCFVNDGSTDGTLTLLERDFPKSHCSHATNMGVSAALLTGFKIAKKNSIPWVIQCDSDGQHPIEMIPHLIEAAKKLKADLLIGSRYFGQDAEKQNKESSTGLRRFGGSLISITLRIFFKSVPVTDPTSGFRVYSQKAVSLFSPQMPDEYPEPELIALASLKGLRIEEIFVKMNARAGGSSSIQGIKTFQFMVKVLTALLGVRLRSLLS